MAAPDLPDEIVESVGINNIKTLGESVAFYTAQQMGNTVSHQKRVDVLAETLLSVACKGLLEVDPAEAVSTLKMLTGDDIGQKLASLGSVIASIQQTMKGAQTTPPVTA